jgi:FkbM family methyltransferase
MIYYFDIGMYHGEVTDKLIDIFEKTNVDYLVMGFEPCKSSFAFLEVKYALNEKVKLHNVAVSDHVDTNGKLYYATTPAGNSLCATKINVSTSHEGCKVIKFSELFKSVPIEKTDFVIVKINVEGSEFEIYKDIISNNIHERVNYFVGSLGDIYKIRKTEDEIGAFLQYLDTALIVVHELTPRKLEFLGVIEEKLIKFISTKKHKEHILDLGEPPLKEPSVSKKKRGRKKQTNQ